MQRRCYAYARPAGSTGQGRSANLESNICANYCQTHDFYAFSTSLCLTSDTLFGCVTLYEMGMLDFYERGDGRWRMDDGRWTMDDGRWTMDDGRWTMDDGRWTMDDGQGTGDRGQGTRDRGQGTRDKGQGTGDRGQGT